MRSSGILLAISSLPSPYGIGTFGKEAYKFVDFLKEAGQTYWQILPICPTSYGNSPYQSCSAYAGNPYFIDLDILCKMGLLKASEYKDVDWGKDSEHVDYGKLYKYRPKVLKKAYERFIPNEEYEAFVVANQSWLEDYCLYMAIKEHWHTEPWWKWEEGLKKRDSATLNEFSTTYAKDIDYHRIIQYLFFKQWQSLKAYANSKGIYFIGDLPIYVARDSVDLWSHPELFLVDEDGEPFLVAGVPGDAFSEDGQLWGNPLYDWEYQAQDSYKWFTERIAYQCSLFDRVRIDHFRGFCKYYAIDKDATTARDGKWLDGPGYALFEALHKDYGHLDLIAEDLGLITDDVRDLLDKCGFPGMKVLEFAFSVDDKDSAYLPHNLIRNCIAYSGTHDNDTIEGWFKSLSKDDKRYVTNYLRLNKEEGYRLGIMRSLWSSVADTVIVQAQDILGLDSIARMNTPSTESGNWSWRMLPNALNKKIAKSLAKDMYLYGRYR